MTKRSSGSIGLASAVAMLATASLAKDLEIKSVWPLTPLKVDGTGDQWAGHLEPLGDLPILLGVANDGAFLYVCLKTSDPKVKAQIARVGMTVWLNGAGKDSRGYGVRFPVGSGFWRPRGDDAAPTPAPSGEQHASGPSIDADDVEMIGPTEEDRFKVPRANADPIQAALGDDAGVMVLELRFPLQATEDHPLAIEAAPGATIALGLETEKPHRQRSETASGGEGGGERGAGGGGGGGGYGPGGGGYGGGGRGGYGGMGGGGRRHGGGGRGIGGEGYDMPKPIKLWTHVSLAVAPAAPPSSK